MSLSEGLSGVMSLPGVWMNLAPLDVLICLAALTLALALPGGGWRWRGPLLVAAYAAQGWALARTNALFGAPSAASSALRLLDQALIWRYDAWSWLLAMLVIGVAFVLTWFASAASWPPGAPRGWSHPRFAHGALALNVLAMLLLLGSGDLLTLYLGLQLASWSGLALTIVATGLAVPAARSALIYALGGDLLVLAAGAWLFSRTDSFDFDCIVAILDAGAPWWLTLLLVGGFAVKLGLLPWQAWRAAVQSQTPEPWAAFLGALTLPVGFYGALILLAPLVGTPGSSVLDPVLISFSLRDLLAWAAALGIALPSLIALRQRDARDLVVWLGIGQGGYALLGVLTGSATGSAGGLLHLFGFVLAQTALLLAVLVLAGNAGSTALDRRGAAPARMTLTRAVLLIAGLSLVGLPPMLGFVSKWLIYQALLAEGMWMPLVGAVLGSLFALLAIGRLARGLDRISPRAAGAVPNEAPAGMLAPLLGVAGLILLAGALPGPALSWTAAVQRSLRLPVVDWHLGGVAGPETALNMPWLAAVLVVSLALSLALRWQWRRRRAPRELPAAIPAEPAGAPAESEHLPMPWSNAGRRGFAARLDTLAIGILDGLATAVVSLHRRVQPLGLALLATLALVAGAILLSAP